MGKISLVKPSNIYKESFKAYATAYKRNADKHYYEKYEKALYDYDGLLEDIDNKSKGVGLQDDEVITSTFWLVDDDIVVGVARIRHEEIGTAGHIGYDISPKYRRMGYGLKILQLALIEAKNIGINEVIVTCNIENIGSINIIEKCNGELLGHIYDEEEDEHLFKYKIRQNNNLSNVFNIGILRELTSNNIELFSEQNSQKRFWDDPHISKSMLEAHLNKDWDAASRKKSTILKTCDFIDLIAKDHNAKHLVDLGCGPGLYCRELYDKGYNILGIDHSKRSIEYAKAEAKKSNRHIEYIYDNYLEMDLDKSFNIAMMIYCDFGVFSYDQRDVMLKKIHSILNPGGLFIFDVWSDKHNELKSEYKKWELNPNGGFWSSSSFAEIINKVFIKEELVSLKQYFIIDEKCNMQSYNLWEQLYTVRSITELLNKHGFEVVDLLSDLTGNEWSDKSECMGIVARKV